MTAPSHVTVRALSAVLVLLGAAGCSGGGGSPPTPTGQPPVITSFAANPSWITTGQSATLKWAVTGATNLSIDPIGPLSGASARVTPVADATYTLTASNQFGSTQAQATLAVFQPPSTWFTPLFENDHTPTVGSSDYFGLFSPTASWASAAAHVSVFKMYAGTLDTYDEASLRNMFSDLGHRGNVWVDFEGFRVIAGATCR
jgi:hypothetical protein